MGVKPGRLVALKTRRQDFRFPGSGWRLETFEHSQCDSPLAQEPTKTISTHCEFGLMQIKFANPIPKTFATALVNSTAYSGGASGYIASFGSSKCRKGRAPFSCVNQRRTVMITTI
jgi:hypothetical protein